MCKKIKPDKIGRGLFIKSLFKPRQAGREIQPLYLLTVGFLVKYSAYAECEIIFFENCEISHAAYGSARCEMKFAHIRVSEYFTFAEQIFHSEAISLGETKFHSPKANFVEKRKSKSLTCSFFFLEAPPRFELGHKGFADLCLTTWLWRRICEDRTSRSSCGADYGARTRHLDLGKVALYQMS